MLQGNATQTVGGLGIIGVRIGGFSSKIILIHPSSPCEGVLQVGDHIIAIDGYKTKTDTRGIPGEPITLTIKRGSEIFDVTVPRVAVQDLHDKTLNQCWGVK